MSDADRDSPEVLLWAPDRVCAALGCRLSWLYDEVEAGRFPVVRLGRQLRFRPADITAYLNTHTQTATEPTPRVFPSAPRRRRRSPTGPRAPRSWT